MGEEVSALGVTGCLGGEVVFITLAASEIELFAAVFIGVEVPAGHYSAARARVAGEIALGWKVVGFY